MEKTTVRLYDIDFDTDGEDIDDLPEEINTTLEEMGWEGEGDAEGFVNMNGADFISDQTGWLVNGFCFELS